MRKVLLFLLAFIIELSVLAQENQSLKTEIFDANLKTVQLYPNGAVNTHLGLRPSILRLNGKERLILEFDDLKASYRQFHVKLQPCDINWYPASLSDLEFLSVYNDFIINDFRVSQNTKIPYFHYGFALPEIKLSGNYILVLYENSLSNERLAQIRFRVLSSQIGINGSIQPAQDPSLWQSHQQVNFEIFFGTYPLQNPRNELKVLIRQNFRDETIKRGFIPSSFNASKSLLTYRFFENENLFPAGNEFRYADLSSTFRKGNNIDEIKIGYEDQIWLTPQASRADKTYLESSDLNGRYFIETIDNMQSSISSDYIHVNVSLETPERPANEKVCFLGGFNYFECSELGEMFYNDQLGLYVKSLLLKQGNYNFQFALMDRNGTLDFSFFEGNFSDTGNTYEVFVYHKPLSARSDLLIGYGLLLNSK